LSWWLRIEEYKKTIFAPKTKRFFLSEKEDEEELFYFYSVYSGSGK